MLPMPWFRAENSVVNDDDDSGCVILDFIFGFLAFFLYLFLLNIGDSIFYLFNLLHPLSWVSYMAPRADNSHCGVAVGKIQ